VVRLRSRDVGAAPGGGDRAVYARRVASPGLGVCAGGRRRRRPTGSAERPRDYASASTVRYLPLVVGATVMVAVVPVAVSLSLRAFGVMSSPWLSMALAGALSFVASVSAGACWRKRNGQAELLFSELLLWGWVRRWRQDRKLAEATALLGLGATARSAGDQTVGAADGGRLLAQLAHALELQDPYLRGHSRRVARHAAMIARRMGLADEEVDRIRVAAVVHDVGKLRTPPEILNKPGPLGDLEFDAIRRHPVDGAELAAVLEDPQLTAIVRHHHERVDGTGYPDRLCGEAIPLGARIIAVADTFDAVTSTRAYRSAGRHSQAIGILRDSAGSQLDAAAVRAFVGYYSSNRIALSWAIASAVLRRAMSWLNGDPVAAAPVCSGKFAAAAVATAAIGSAAAVAPIAAVNAAGMLAAAPSVTQQPGQFGGGWPAQHRGQPAANNQQRQPAPANSLAHLAAAWMSSPLPGQPGVLRGAAFPAIGPPPLDPVNSSRSPARARNLAASLFAAPSPTPSRNTTPTSAASLTNPLPGTSSAPSTENPAATAQPSPTPQSSTHRPSGPEAGNRSARPHGTGQGSSHANTGPNNPGNTHGQGHANRSGQGNAHGQGNGGGQGNASGQGNGGGQGNPGGQGNANGEGNGGGQGNPGGQGNGGGQGNPGGQGNAYGQGNGGGQGNPGGQGNAYGQGNGGGQGNPSGQGNANGQGNGGGQGNANGQGNGGGQGNPGGQGNANGHGDRGAHAANA
jgi:putative nucleotidyltransferase with HDIG domain